MFVRIPFPDGTVALISADTISQVIPAEDARAKGATMDTEVLSVILLTNGQAMTTTRSFEALEIALGAV